MSSSEVPAPNRPRIARRVAVLVIVGWVVLLGALSSFAPALDAVKDNDNDNPPDESMSMRAATLAEQELGADSSPPAIIVVSSSSPEMTRASTADVVSAIRRAQVPGIAVVVDSDSAPESAGLVNADGTAEMVVIGLSGSPTDDQFRTAVGDLRTIAADAVDDDTQVALTGPAGIAVDAVKVFGGSDKLLLLGTIGLVVVLLFAIYRSPALVVVSLLSVGLAMRLAEGLGALLADADVIRISGQTSSIMTVLLFGVGTDYALIIFSRLRESLTEFSDPRVAVRHAMRSVAGALFASVSTIVVAVLALLAAVTPTLRDFGPYLALGVISMAAVAFTFTPAVLVLLGRYTFWPARPVQGEATRPSRLWGRVADLVTTAPRRVLALGVAVLVVMSGGLIGVQQSFDLVSGFRIKTESAAGLKLLGNAFGPGAVAPSELLVRSEAAVSDAQIRDIAKSLATAPGVAQSRAGAASQDGKTASIQVILDHNPYSAEAMDLIPDLVNAGEDAAATAGVPGAEILVGGESSVAADTRSALDRDLVVVGVLMVLAVALILGLVLRSVLAPLYLAATLLLSYAATMGATAFLALTVGGDLGIGNRVAVYVLVFLVALGVDYTIFMMARYRQELTSSGSLEALRTSIVRTGGVISSAGVILAGTFAVLMTQPIRELFQFGLAMAIGILLDTFLVRPLLVPACIQLLGRRALWPTYASKS